MNFSLRFFCNPKLLTGCGVLIFFVTFFWGNFGVKQLNPHGLQPCVFGGHFYLWILFSWIHGGEASGLCVSVPMNECTIH
jgi:hypothetical protein